MENCLAQIKSIFSKSSKNRIAVVGKGASVKEITRDFLEEFFVINLNDVEHIVGGGDLTLFYRTDLFQKLKSTNFKSKYYLSPSFFKIPDEQHIEVEHHPADQDSLEFIDSYFQRVDFFLTDFIILSAIKLCIELQNDSLGELEVYLLGFDFYSDSVDSGDYDMHDLEYKKVILKTQESLFIRVLENFLDWNPKVNIHHVGEKHYSDLSVQGFNELVIKNRKKIAENRIITNTILYKELALSVQEEGRVMVVAEFTNNHIGDDKRLIKMINLAKEGGADIIKLQKRDVDSFYTEEELNRPYKSPFGNTLGDYRRGVELTKEQFEMVDKECRRLEIPWFVSVLDWNSYVFLREFDIPLLKLPSTISNHKNYLLKVGEDFSGDLVISTGFTDATYEQFVLDNFMSENRRLFLLQCTSSYPTPPEACQVSVVRHYDELASSKYSNLYSGYSSHDVGSLGCMLAVAAGAKMLEKHVKLGDLDWIHFDGVAIDLYNNKFKDFVHDVRKAQVMCGSKNKTIHSLEHHKYIPNQMNN